MALWCCISCMHPSRAGPSRLTGIPAAFMVVADEQFGRQIPFAFLERVREEWASKWAEKGPSAVAHSLDKLFGPRLKHWMEYCEQHPEELSKVASVQKKVRQGEGCQGASRERGKGLYGGQATVTEPQTLLRKGPYGLQCCGCSVETSGLKAEGVQPGDCVHLPACGKPELILACKHGVEGVQQLR